MKTTQSTHRLAVGEIVGRALSLVLSIVILGTVAQAHEEDPRIQLAMLLDTSSSMDGLISQAQTQLWKIVNEFAVAERDGQSPRLEVALYEYGKSALPAGEGYIRMILPLTTDLDAVSEELFDLRTQGGDEYCGWVIRNAVDDLEWSPSDRDFKAIFIAGNEPFTQGEVDFRSACRASIDRQIVVNTIHCGSYQEGVNGQWQEGALLADGKYMSIDQNRAVVHIPAPQDDELLRLSAELNETYTPFGSEGAGSAARQRAQDVLCMDLAPSVSAERAIFKASSHYQASSWDLVDAVKEGEVDLETLDEDTLPVDMKNLSVEERRTLIAERRTQREAIQQRIQRLSDERKKYVAEKKRDTAEEGGETFDDAMIEALREQVQERGFNLK